MTTAQRGYGSRWQRERAEYLCANPFCRKCRERGLYTAASVVDHVKPHNGNPQLFWDQTNWQPLCAPCHSSDKQREEIAERYGRAR